MQGQGPTISVITVCFNAADDLEKTILSVARQSYRKVEYIVIDGGSRDRTVEVLSRYADLFSVVLSEPDRGIYDAMNKGITLATGDYLCFMNAGDTFHTDDTLSQVFEQVDATCLPGVIYGDTDIVDAEGRFLRHRRLTPPEVLTADSFRSGMVVCHQSFYARRDLVPYYDLQYRYSADVDWCIKILRSSPFNLNTRLTLTDFMDGGTTTRHHRASLIERFRIMSKHFGLLPTVWRHIGFLIRAFTLR